MAKKRDKKRQEDPKTRETATQPPNSWKIPVIILILILIGITVCLAQYYVSSSTPMECYQCNWISRSNGPPLASDPCGYDQRSMPNNAHVKTCGSDQPYCGTLHISFSYLSAGNVKQFEFAFIRDCFTQYPLPYIMQIENYNRTYYGTRDGNIYPNLAGIGLNMTVVGHHCGVWNKCNSNIPKEGLGWAFLDSINILHYAKEKGLNVWNGLVQFVQQANKSNSTLFN